MYLCYYKHIVIFGLHKYSFYIQLFYYLLCTKHSLYYLVTSQLNAFWFNIVLIQFSLSFIENWMPRLGYVVGSVSSNEMCIRDSFNRDLFLCALTKQQQTVTYKRQIHFENLLENRFTFNFSFPITAVCSWFLNQQSHSSQQK